MSNRPTAAAQAPLAIPVKKHGEFNISKRSTLPSSTVPITTAGGASSGRKYDAVKPEYSVRRAATFAGHSPQLTERDSIFAEHYIPSQNDPTTSPPTTPGATGEPLACPMPSSPHIPARPHPQAIPHHGKNLVTQPAIRTSGQPASILRRSSDTLNPPRVKFGRLGMPGQQGQDMYQEAASKYTDNDTRPPNPSSTILSDTAVEDTPEQRARSEHGSSLKEALREARTDRSTSRGRARVEKSIEISLANAEPVKNARSRKSSHIMGLFQDYPPASGLRRSDDNEGRSDISTSPSRPTSPKARQGTPDQRPRDDFSHTDTRTTPSSPLRPDHDPYFRKQDQLKRTSSSTKPSIPPKLLQQIRDHHNLVPSNLRDSYTLIIPEKDSDGKNRDSALIGQEARATKPRTPEQVQEHISKVVYKPHTGRHSEEIDQKAPELVTSHIGDMEGSGDFLSQEKIKDTPDPTRSGGDTALPEHIDVSIKSKHGKRLFHGNYQPPDELKEVDVQKFKLSTVDEVPLTYAASSASESEFESGDEYGQANQTGNGELTPTAASGGLSPSRSSKTSPSTVQKGIVNLEPYKHQVGGHSTMFEFSRKAVAKELNNHENQFYENAERRYKDLLEFLPKYLGVANFTFTEGPDPLDCSPAAESATPRKKVDEEALQHFTNGSKSEIADKVSHVLIQPRIVSQSQHLGATPQFLLDQNRHIVPPSFFDLPERPRSADPHHGRKASADLGRALLEQGQFAASTDVSRSPSRPPGPEHSASWGTTVVNTKLAQEVFQEILKGPPIHHRRRRGATHNTIPKLRDSNSRRRSNLSTEAFNNNLRYGTKSDEVLSNGPGQGDVVAASAPAPELFPSSDSIYENLNRLEKVQTTTSISSHGSAGSGKRSVRRRHSGMALRRRRTSVNSSEYVDLEYFDDESYPADGENEVFAMDGEEATAPATKQVPGPATRDSFGDPKSAPSSGEGSRANLTMRNGTGNYAEPSNETDNMPLPLNPKDSRTMAPGSRLKYYIILANLTLGMGRPCAMDLKMGTRQYGVEATKKKMESQRRKCKTTTSQQLGVRVCGMQTFDAKKQQVVYESKYFGRDLKPGREFQETLTKFLYDGISYTSVARHIPTILEKISKLEKVIRRMPGFRFYASSLLLIYDAEPYRSTEAREFAAQQGTDSEKGADKLSGDNANKRRKKKAEFEAPKIQLKMLDFANCVQPEDDLTGTNYPPQHPHDIDRGYLRGLRTLRMYFRRILKDITGQEYQERGDHEATATDHGEAQGRIGDGDEEDGLEHGAEYEDEGEVSM